MHERKETPMDEAAITAYITGTFPGVTLEVASAASGAPEVAWGDSFFTYDPDGTRAAQGWLPFATIVTKDYGDFDNASHLNRPGVFRLNIGVSAQTFRELFGPPVPDANAGSDGAQPRDFAALDRVMPHPVYGKQHWVCVLNPSAATFHTAVRPLLAEAYTLAASRYGKRTECP